MLEGFGKRLEKEIRKHIPSTLPLEIKDTKDKLLLVWQGSSVFSSLSTCDEEYITKKEYEENGTKMVYKKSL